MVEYYYISLIVLPRREHAIYRIVAYCPYHGKEIGRTEIECLLDYYEWDPKNLRSIIDIEDEIYVEYSVEEPVEKSTRAPLTVEKYYRTIYNIVFLYSRKRFKSIEIRAVGPLTNIYEISIVKPFRLHESYLKHILKLYNTGRERELGELLYRLYLELRKRAYTDNEDITPLVETIMRELNLL